MRIRVSRTKSVQNYYILLEPANKNAKNTEKWHFFSKKFVYVVKKQYFCGLFRVKSASLILTRAGIRVIQGP